MRKKKKNPNAVALGKLGGSKGGRIRAERLTAERRKEIARKAVKARWDKVRDVQKSEEERSKLSWCATPTLPPSFPDQLKFTVQVVRSISQERGL